jgi:hypothetical protein
MLNYVPNAPRYYNNTIILNLSNLVGTPESYPFSFSAGIAATFGSNNYFSNNTITVSASNSNNSYYGIALNQMFLDSNFDNFTNNTFTTGGLGVFAEYYPINPTYPYPNNTSNSVITNGIFLRNAFH